MKINVKKITSVTLLTSLVLTNLSSPIMSAMTYAMESEKVVVNAEETEVMATESLTEELLTEDVSIEESSILAASETEMQELESASDEISMAAENVDETETEVITEDHQTETVENSAESEIFDTENQENKEVSDLGATESFKETESEHLAETESTKETEIVTEADTGKENESEKNTETEMDSEVSIEQDVSIKVKLELAPATVAEENSNFIQQGDPQEVKISVVNPSEGEARFRIYFWDYNGDETIGKNIPKELLTDPCEDLEIPAMEEKEYFPIVLTGSEEETISAECTLCEEWQENLMIARYLETVIPAGCTWEDSLIVENEMAEKVVIDPVIVENEGMDYDKLLLKWNEKEVIEETEVTDNAEVTENPEEQTTEDLNVEAEETGEAADTETVTESGSEMAEENTTESLTESETTAETDEIITEEDLEETEALIEIPDYLNPEDFVSKRLIVMCGDASKILEADQVIGCYENIYLIEYETVEDCMAAYVYYTGVVDAVEPDVFMEIASNESTEDNTETTETTITEDNPITALSNTEGAAVLSDGKTRVIALLDTGASESPNVISRVSLIDDVLEGHSHGNSMVNAITSQNPDAQILSIRVMGNDGRGTVSAIVAGMEYAMENGASIINLSLSSAKNSLNAVLEAEIQKAVSMGIIVVGAAGNNAADVMNYMPGSVNELKAPIGHQVVTDLVAVTVSMPTDALKLKTASFTEGFSEPYDYMQVEALVEKLSMYGNPVEGVAFKVCYYDDKTANAAKLAKTWYLVSDAQGKVFLDQKHLYTKDTSMKSDAFYVDASTNKVILPIGGYLTIQEVKAPAQYMIDDTVRGFATKKMVFTTQRLYNEEVPCEIRLKKYDQTGAKPLAGVQFELKFLKAAQKDTSLKSSYTRLLQEGEKKVQATDKNGEIVFDNLAQGTYEITEIKTVAGQTLLKEKITVELPITMTKAEAQSYGNVDFDSAKEDKGYTDKWFFYECLYEITNEPQFHLPQTGGFGIWKYGYAGILILMLAGGILFLGRKKRKTI